MGFLDGGCFSPRPTHDHDFKDLNRGAKVPVKNGRGMLLHLMTGQPTPPYEIRLFF